jgi:hypothetical protein
VIILEDSTTHARMTTSISFVLLSIPQERELQM